MNAPKVEIADGNIKLSFAQFWMEQVKSLGVSVVFMLVILYLVGRYVPPWLESQVKLMDRMGDAVESMEIVLRTIDTNIQSQAKLLRDISVSDYPRAEFRTMVHEEHAEHYELLSEVAKDVKDIHKETCTSK